MNESAWVRDYTPRLFKPRLNSLLKKWLTLWSKGVTLEESIHHVEFVNHWCHELKILLACEIFLWQLTPRLSLTKPALGGAQINICNGKSGQKDRLYWVCSAVVCFVIQLESYWEGGCRLELTLTLNMGSVWGSSVHSLPLCKGTNAQQLLLRKNCSEILSWKQSMEELLGKLVNFNLPGIRMLT